MRRSTSYYAVCGDIEGINDMDGLPLLAAMGGTQDTGIESLDGIEGMATGADDV
jgi:hypothetical protein